MHSFSMLDGGEQHVSHSCCLMTTVNRHYNAQNLTVYNCEFLEMLRHSEGFVVRKLFKM
jgi:hypothetical protein